MTGAAMSTGLLVAIIIVVVALLVVAFLLGQQRRTQRLRDRFGPEYQRTVARTGDRRAGEAKLAEREQRRNQLEVVELDPSTRTRYVEAWRVTQGRFVDDPVAATREADELVSTVMRDRGYPVDDFEQRADDISGDHPQVAENYRAAHAVSLANERGLASTDDLRQAFVHDRSLFAELLDSGQSSHKEEVQ
jgi:FtsZ-interacting cell division protein ZipA